MRSSEYQCEGTLIRPHVLAVALPACADVHVFLTSELPPLKTMAVSNIL